FKTLELQVSNLGIDLKALRNFIEQNYGKSSREAAQLDEKLEVLLNDIDNIDTIMGLTISNKYYVVKRK
ncbi:MAG: hypothetical protein JW997_02850, partial [Actinobacteria bacterium]|nr:hypothetical protein [Actinomycetota bacterium]